MGLFSNPKCPRYGRETTTRHDMFESYYTCIPCSHKAQKEHNEKVAMEKRVKDLEEKLAKLEDNKTSGDSK